MRKIRSVKKPVTTSNKEENSNILQKVHRSDSNKRLLRIDNNTLILVSEEKLKSFGGDEAKYARHYTNMLNAARTRRDSL